MREEWGMIQRYLNGFMIRWRRRGEIIQRIYAYVHSTYMPSHMKLRQWPITQFILCMLLLLKNVIRIKDLRFLPGKFLFRINPYSIQKYRSLTNNYWMLGRHSWEFLPSIGTSFPDCDMLVQTRNPGHGVRSQLRRGKSLGFFWCAYPSVNPSGEVTRPQAC